MQYTLIEKGEVQLDESSLFIEGAVLAANLTTKPLAPEAWLERYLVKVLNRFSQRSKSKFTSNITVFYVMSIQL